MMSSWWWLWMAFMFLVLMPPVGYGWGYRGWGPPYPRYIQRRRKHRAATGVAGAAVVDHEAWGWGGDLLWGGLVVGLVWAMCVLYWWP